MNAQSMARTKETVLEDNQRGDKAEEQSNTKATLYKNAARQERHNFSR